MPASSAWTTRRADAQLWTSRDAKYGTTLVSVVDEKSPASRQEPPASVAQHALEEALRTSERRLETITANAPDFILEVDREGRITFVNRTAPNRTREETLGTQVAEWLIPEHRSRFELALREAFDRGQAASCEARARLSGRCYQIRIGAPTTDHTGQRAIVMTHDISELKEVEAQLRESEHRFRTLVDGYLDALAISVDGRLIEVNETCAKLFGYSTEELVGKTAFQLATEETAREVMSRIQRGAEEPYEGVGVRKDGSTFPCEIFGRNLSYRGLAARLSVFRDITERVRVAEEHRLLEQQMWSAQKLESLGALAGGIAHDFNNLLQIMLGNIELAKLGLPGGEASTGPKTQLEHARAAALRAGEVVRQMLTYSGRGPLSSSAVSVGDSIREITELLAVSVSKNASLAVELSADLPPAQADPTQLRQVLLNLITNASDAIGLGSGTIRVETSVTNRSSIPPDTIRVRSDALPEALVCIEVADDGRGMDRATLDRIFDPFFTTKFAGHGLGLASVSGIVRAHHGAIGVETAPGAGSVFRVYLPQATPKARPSAAHDARHVDTAISGRLLVADDEPRLRDLLVKLLESRGIHVTVRADGLAAATAFASTPEAFDAVILDVTMPNLGGVEALERMRLLRPRLPALLMSGYTEAQFEPSSSPAKTVFLGKPFGKDELLAAVWSLLHPPDTSSSSA